MGTSPIAGAELPADNMPPLFVLDTTAHNPCPVREHEIIVGHEGGAPILKTYTFNTGKRVEMPFEHAAQFLKGEGFVVSRDEAGDNIFQLTPEGTDGMGQVVLKDDQVVANLTELTAEALRLRCSQLATKLGEKTPDNNVRKEKLVDYLTIHASKTREAELIASEEDGEGERMSDSETAALLGEMED